MYITRIEHIENARIERTEKAVSYDKVVYIDSEKQIVKLMYRLPDGSIKRYWVGEAPDDKLKHADQVFIMNEHGKTIDRI